MTPPRQGKHYLWTRAEIAIVLQGHAAGRTAAEVSTDIMGRLGLRRTSEAVYEKARVMRAPLRRKSHMSLREPPEAAWIEAATAAARARGLRPSDVLGPSIGRKLAIARWHAWRAVLDAYPHVSIAGLGRVSGYDHTSILHGLKRLSVQNYPQALATEIRQA